MVKVSYDTATGEIKGFYPDCIAYDSIPEPYIEIGGASHMDCINNQGRRRVDIDKKVIVEYTPPGPAEEEILTATKAAKLSELDRAAAAAYVAGFYSTASGQRLYYDSDPDTQKLIDGVYSRTKESDWETKVRYPGVAPAGKAPIRARLTATDPDTAKTVQLLDATQLKALVEDLDAHLFKVKSTLWQKQAEVETAYQAGNADDIQKVIWPL